MTKKRISKIMNNLNILSPIDAKVKAIDIENNNYKIYLDTSFVSSNSILAPISAKIKNSFYIKGVNLSPDTYKSSLLNERAVVEFDKVKLFFRAGICSKKIQIENKKELTQGEIFGKFYSGTLIVQMDKTFDICVQIGDIVKSGQTIIGKYDE